MFNKAEITLLPRAASRAKNAAKPRLRRPVPIARRSSVLFFGSGFGWSCTPFAWKKIALPVERQKCVTG